MTVKARPVLEQLRTEYGGTIQNSREATERWDAACCWVLCGSEAASFLTRILPYLRLKEEQARVGLKVEEIRLSLPKPAGTRARWIPEASQRCAVLKRRMHELNAKGPSTLSPGSESPVAWLVAGTWVTSQADLFSDLGWAPYSETLPRSGSMRNGRLYERPTSAPRTGGSGGSSSRGLLPTPTVSDANGVGPHGTGALDLRTTVSLLPTPTINGNNNYKGASPTSQDGLTTVLRKVSSGAPSAPPSIDGPNS
jgi:hypothetical protein